MSRPLVERITTVYCGDMCRRRFYRHTIDRSVFAVALAVALLGCSGGKSGGDGGGNSSAGTNPNGATAGGSAAQAASQVDNSCSVIPVDLVRQYIPDAADPQLEPDQFNCSMTNNISVVQVAIQGLFGEPDPLVPGEELADMGEKAWVQEQIVDDAYVVVFLGIDDNGTYQTLSVEYAGNDGIGHKDAAIAITRQIIATLGG